MNNFYSLLRFYKKTLKLNHPLYLRRVKMPKNLDGDCSLLASGFLIRIERSFEEAMAIEILIHEIAHCLSWDEGIDHGFSWGRSYSIVYKKFLEWLDEKNTN